MISWTAPDSNKAIQYYVYRDDIILPNNPTSSTQYTDTDQLMVNTPYSYSVIANSCAGNSTGGVETEFNSTGANICFIEIIIKVVIHTNIFFSSYIG